jgi:hypothetical protein
MNNYEFIKENWFQNHTAKMSEFGDLKVLEWNDGTFWSSIRYVLDNGKLYVTGDRGDAIFQFYSDVTFEKISGFALEYFAEKLTASSREKVSFDSYEATKELRSWLNDLKEEGTEYDHDLMKDLFNETRQCSSKEGWSHILNENSYWMSELCSSLYEDFYNVGDTIPRYMEGFLIGLQMAMYQLKQKEIQTA